MLTFYRSLLCAAITATVLSACSAATPPKPPDRISTAGGTSTSTSAARAFLAALPDSARGAVLRLFDGGERTTWAYVPQERAGLSFKGMLPEQRAAAELLVATGLSESGSRTARAIMQLESTLGALEEDRGRTGARARRDPDLYYLAVFGTPSETSPWGWRFEGHHLSVNVTHVGEEQIIAPLFMGVNPARVPSGPQAGLRLLAEEEDLARELLFLLDAGQRDRAIIAEATSGDISTRNDPAVAPLAFEGLAVADMVPEQRVRLRRLLEVYVSRMDPAAAREQLQRIERAGFERLHFAWAGGTTPGVPHYYRLHGPTVLVEYDNTQDKANHVHTVWRDLENDFGGDLLRRHYARQTHRH